MRHLLAVLLTAVLMQSVWAAETFSGPGPLPVLESTEVLRDPSGRLDIGSVSVAAESRFNAAESRAGSVAAGFTSDVLWLRMRLARTTDAPEVLWLALREVFLDDVRLYVPGADGGYTELRAGDHVPVAERPLPLRKTVFPLALQTTPQTFYLRIETSSVMTMYAELWEPRAYMSWHAADSTLQGAILGLFAAVTLVAFACALWTRQKFFLVAMGYLVAHGLLHSQLRGYDQLLLYPGAPWLADNLLGVTASFLLTMLILFAVTYLQPQERLPRLTRFLQGVAGVAAVMGAVSAAGHYRLVGPWLFPLAIVTTPLLIVMFLLVWRVQRQRATLMLLMFFPGLIAALLVVLFNFGVIPEATWSLQFWEMTVLSKLPFVAVVLWLYLNEDQERRRALAQQDDARRSLLNMVAHELRNPLAVVHAAIANIEGRTQESHPELTPRFQRIESALGRLDVLVDTALAKHDVDDSGLRRDRQLLRPSELARRVEKMVLLDDRHPLHVQLPRNDEPLVVDAHWLSLAVVSLLDNASKYSPNGGEIVLDIERDAHLTIRVCDQGIGVPEESRHQVFETSYRAANAQQLGIAGLGLGLSIVQQVAHSHGGEAYLDVARGPGACFVIRFPAIAEQAQQPH